MSEPRHSLLYHPSVHVPAPLESAKVPQVRAVTPWHTLSNRVEFTAFGRHRTIGDMLLRDETTEVEHALKKAIGVAE